MLLYPTPLLPSQEFKSRLSTRLHLRMVNQLGRLYVRPDQPAHLALLPQHRFPVSHQLYRLFPNSSPRPRSAGPNNWFGSRRGVSRSPIRSQSCKLDENFVDVDETNRWSI